jgi:hypothetical protein
VARTYDSAGRLQSVVMPSGTTNYDYFSTTGSAPGQLSKIRGPYGVDVALDYFGRLLKSQTWSGTVVGSVSRAYDNDFAVTTETIAGATGTATLLRAYDNDKLVKCVSATNCTTPGTDAMQIVRDTKTGFIRNVTLGKVGTMGLVSSPKKRRRTMVHRF